MKKITVLFFISTISIIAMAHEFWLHPHKFFYTIREIAVIRFRVGENFTGINWSGNSENIQQLKHYTPSGMINDLTDRVSKNKGDSVQIPMQEEGTHMVVFNSTNSSIDLAPEKFTEYLKEDGLDQALLYRKNNGEENNHGKEFYQRSVKTIFQVGTATNNTCTAATDLPLDIIPDQNPYEVPEDAVHKKSFKVQFRVQFKYAPLKNALVKVWYMGSDNKVKMENLRTNQKGFITTNRHSGPMMISCVHMIRTEKGAAADWQSYWSSLTFEYSQFF
ncbi:MAG: hypothetical protein RLZZ28_226 [Bacteroidota bacterium]|jgi:uncharacterized GH25 family protein